MFSVSFTRWVEVFVSSWIVHTVARFEGHKHGWQTKVLVLIGRFLACVQAMLYNHLLFSNVSLLLHVFGVQFLVVFDAFLIVEIQPVKELKKGRNRIIIIYRTGSELGNKGNSL